MIQLPYEIVSHILSYIKDLELLISLQYLSDYDIKKAIKRQNSKGQYNWTNFFLNNYVNCMEYFIEHKYKCSYKSLFCRISKNTF